MLVLQVREWLQIYGTNALICTSQVDEQPSKRSKKNGDKSAVAMLKITRQLGCVSQDMEPPKFEGHDRTTRFDRVFLSSTWIGERKSSWQHARDASLLVLSRFAHEQPSQTGGVLNFTFVVDNDTTVHGVHTHTVAFSHTVLIKCRFCLYSFGSTPSTMILCVVLTTWRTRTSCLESTEELGPSANHRATSTLPTRHLANIAWWRAASRCVQ